MFYIYRIIFSHSSVCCAYFVSHVSLVKRFQTKIYWKNPRIFILKIKIKGGGQHVNPAVTVSMWALGKVSYTETFVRIAGQMGGGLVAFPCFQFVSEQMNLTPFGGPEFSKENDVDAFLQEFCASFLLMWAIYIVRFPYPFFP